MTESTSHLKNRFLELRAAWFETVLYHRPHEREPEDEEAAKFREEDNKRLREKYDSQTLAILFGGPENVAPRCPNEV